MPAYGALAVAFAVVGYFELFTHFRDYDDEGYIALSVREFVAGGSLYGDVYSQYGPFLHELWGIGISLTAGIAVHRLTRRMTLGRCWRLCSARARC